MKTCIPDYLIEKIKILNLDVPTEERNKILRQFFDEQTSIDISKQFERSLLLKKQEVAYDKFLNNLSDTGIQKKAELKVKVAEELSRKRKLMYNSDGSINPNFENITNSTQKDIQDFVKKSIDRKYDLSLTSEETKNLVGLKKVLEETKKLPQIDSKTYDPLYGEALDNYNQYLNDLKSPTDKMKLGEQMKYNLNQFKEGFKQSQGAFNKSWFVTKGVGNFVFSNTWKTIKASLDASFLGVQGAAIATRNPKVFIESANMARKAFVNKDIMKAFRINLFSKVGYEDAIKAGLRVLKPEEQFASTAVEKMPGIGKLFKGADDAFSVFLQNSRIGEYERVLNNTEIKLGKKLDSSIPEDLKILKEIADHANKVTGTANLGGAEKYSDLMNNVLFAGRYAVSDIKNFTDILDPRLSSEARKRATTTLALNVATLYGTYLTIASLNPDRTEINPNNANFMKYKTDDGVWVGFPKLKGQWIVQLISKLVEGSEVNASGKKTVYGKGYKPKTRADVVAHTVRGKLAPVPSVLTDLMVGKTYDLQKPTLSNELLNLTAPISAGNIVERSIQNDDPLMTQMKLDFADFIGLTAYKTK